jgi:hypothetical protein
MPHLLNSQCGPTVADQPGRRNRFREAPESDGILGLVPFRPVDRDLRRHLRFGPFFLRALDQLLRDVDAADIGLRLQRGLGRLDDALVERVTVLGRS